MLTGEEPGETHNTISGGIQFGPVLQGRDIHATFQLPLAMPTALAQLPPQIAGFTGRDGELAVLVGLLDPEQSAEPVVISAVTGLAGVGKTTLAVEAGHAALARGWFAGGVLFIDLHGYDNRPVESGQALDALLRALGVPTEHIPLGTEERAGLYRSVLAETIGPVLVIADNASSEAQVRPLLPGTGPHKVLVTSRHTLAGLGARLVDVTVLNEPASVALLDAALRAARPGDDRITADPESAGRLARVCGGLPLALQIVAALLKSDLTLGICELADELADESQRLVRLAYDDGSGPSAPSVAAAFELSYRRLDANAARLFRLLPVNPGPDVSTTAAAVLADLPISEVRTLLAGLTRAHLAEAAPAVAGRWRMHDLLRLYAQRLSDDHAEADGREQARDRLLGHYLRMADAANDHLRALPGMAVPEEFTGRDGALAWLDAERTSLVAAVSMAAHTGRDQGAARLPSALVDYLMWRRLFDDVLTTSTISLSAAQRIGDRHYEGRALTNLGIALQAVGRLEEAITACQDAAAIFRETGDRHYEGKALTNLSVSLQSARRLEEAITACQDAAAIFRETGDRHGEGSALTDLGLALQAVGQLEEAITAQQDAAAIFRKAGDRHGEGLALGNLGLALQEVGRLEEAITAQQDAAAIYRETGDRHGEGLALTNLGLAQRGTRRFEEAITACQDAAAIYRETGDRHGEGLALTNLGLAQRGTRRFEEAITACQDAAAIYRETGDRPGEGLALANLGLALQDVRRFEEAVTIYQQGLVIFRETGDRPGEGNALTNLGRALREVRRFEEAISACQDAAAIYRETGDQPGEGLALNRLGIALQQARRFEEAITVQQDAAAIFREAGDRPGEGLALTNLGNALQEVGRLEEGITAHRQAAAIFRVTGDRHGEGMALGNLGATLPEVGRFEEAITACQDAAAIFRETGDRHGEGSALGNLGLALRGVRRFEEAVTAHQQDLVICRETGDRHGEGIALYNLGNALPEVGRFEEAVTACQDAAAIFRETGDQDGEGAALHNLGLAMRKVQSSPERHQRTAGSRRHLRGDRRPAPREHGSG